MPSVRRGLWRGVKVPPPPPGLPASGTAHTLALRGPEQKGPPPEWDSSVSELGVVRRDSGMNQVKTDLGSFSFRNIYSGDSEGKLFILVSPM